MITSRFNPGWKLSLFTLGFLPLLLWLGLWQLEREQEKIILQRDHETRALTPALLLTEVDWSSSTIAYLKVNAHGQYDNERAFLLDNRIFEGRVGYEVLSPFVTEQGDNLLVNRGWIEAGPTRSELPVIREIAGNVQITGTVYVPLDEPFLLSNIQEENLSWPRVVQSLRMDEFSKQLAIPLLPYTLRLVENSPGLEQDNWPTVNMLPEKHRAYAVQWFVMAFALVSMYVYFGFKHPASTKHREQQ